MTPNPMRSEAAAPAQDLSLLSDAVVNELLREKGLSLDARIEFLCKRVDILLRQCTGPSAFGGTSFGVDSVEWELAQSGVIETELPRCPHATASTAVTPES